MKKTRVVVGISGGVDSGVAAYLLKKEGYDVVGLFMRNWHDSTGLKSGGCSYEDDVLFARMVAEKIGIPFHEVDLSEEYKKRVVDYLFREYSAGRTPNPDVLCNREIKFDAFAAEAFKLGADYVATGHYCRRGVEETPDGVFYQLIAGKDDNKDQSYFLCQLNQEQLKRAMFPLGDLTKPEVREIAREQDLANAERKDSQGICFVGKVDLPTFLQQRLKTREGKVIEIPVDFPVPGPGSSVEELAAPLSLTQDSGKMAGHHNGAHFYTVGQRKGLNIGGRPEPLFIVATDTEKNIVYVGQGKNHPLLLRQALFMRHEDLHWVRPDLKIDIGEENHYLVRIRYRQELQKAQLIMKKAGAYILFENPQRAIVPGQFAAWYKEEELVGSGVIQS